MENYEKLGLFYLGRELSEDGREAAGPLMLYPSANLSTHALCVGMTGSGKTGLCIDMLEEAAIDGIPALIIDPKGDMANLCLGFPEMRAEDFLPWVNPEEAVQKGISREELAAGTAETWRRGLAEWGQSPDRIRLLRQNADITVYTPGSTTGEPLSILNLFNLPPQKTIEDAEALADLVSGTASGLLGLLGIEADALNSREHILISNILKMRWQAGQETDLASLIASIQRPPFQTIGILDLEAFYPESERFRLALRFNNLLASPSFAAWLEGEPLDIDRLLYNREGKPRLAIVSIAHLAESERMFFVTLLLNQVLAWTRRQGGSSGLRAILYMDEIYGYFPPVKNPPSKQALITLLKQARAYGLAVMLTTQNPVDLDYKGLSNIGTWIIGRLQTENDRKRLLDGLQGAVSASGGSISAAEIDRLLAGLGKRCFLLHNVHKGHPSLFMSRWALSYLKGPMSRAEIRQLKDMNLYDKADGRQTAAPAAEPNIRPVQPEAPFLFNGEAEPVQPSEPAYSAPEPAAATQLSEGGDVQVPSGIPSYLLPGAGRSGSYRPLVGAMTEIYYKEADGSLSEEREVRVAEISDGVFPVDWTRSDVLKVRAEDLDSRLPANGRYESLPAPARKKSSFTQWSKDLQDYLYRNKSVVRYENPGFKLSSQPGEDERAFRIRLQQETRDQREREIDALRDKYERRLATLEERVRKAAQAVEREKEQAGDAKRQAAISVGSTILSAIFGKKALSTTTFNKAATAGRGASRAARAGADIGRAEETLQRAQEKYDEMVQRMEQELADLTDRLEAKSEDIRTVEIKPLKRDINVRVIGVFWE